MSHVPVHDTNEGETGEAEAADFDEVRLMIQALTAAPYTALGAIGRLHVLLRELETRTLEAVIGDGYSFAAAARALGTSRQAVLQRLQRRENDRRRGRSSSNVVEHSGPSPTTPGSTSCSPTSPTPSSVPPSPPTTGRCTACSHPTDRTRAPGP